MARSSDESYRALDRIIRGDDPLAAARREGVIEGLERALVQVNELRRDNCSLAEARTWLRAEIERLRAEQKEQP